MNSKAKIENFEDLEIWQNARILAVEVYEITQKSPFANDFRFKSQMTSSVGSIMDNIAEGFERGGNKEFIQFLSFAKGSCGETRSQTHRAYDFKYIDEETYKVLIEKLFIQSRQISSMMTYLKKSKFKGEKFKK